MWTNLLLCAFDPCEPPYCMAKPLLLFLYSKTRQQHCYCSHFPGCYKKQKKESILKHGESLCHFRSCVLCSSYWTKLVSPDISLCGLTFTWLGRCGSCLRHEPTELARSFSSVLVSISVFMALSTVFYSINSPENSLFSHSALPVLSLPYWSFQLYVSLWKSPSALI